MPFMFLLLPLPALMAQGVLEISGGGTIGYLGSKSWKDFRDSYNSTFSTTITDELDNFGFTGGYEFGLNIQAMFFLAVWSSAVCMLPVT